MLKPPRFLCFSLVSVLLWLDRSRATAGWEMEQRVVGEASPEIGGAPERVVFSSDDLPAGLGDHARFKLWHGNQQNGSATVWSGANGAPIREWDGEWPDGLFGHWSCRCRICREMGSRT